MNSYFKEKPDWSLAPDNATHVMYLERSGDFSFSRKLADEYTDCDDENVFFVTEGDGGDIWRVVEERPPNPTAWSKSHYDINYKLTPKDIKQGFIRVDPYFVYKQWGLSQHDDTGCLFHNLKTITRFGSKNDVGREIKALYAQTKRMGELYGVELED